MSIKNRTKEFIEHKGLTVSGFEEMCNLSNGYVSSMRKGYGREKLNNVLNAFPDLNRDWLLYGEGDMIKVPATVTVFNPTLEERKGTEDRVDLSVVPAEIIEEIEEEIKEKMAIPIISPEIANAPNTNIRKYIRDKGDELKHIYINDLTQGARVAECVESTSMWPMLQPGDWVFVKFIDKDSIIDGKIYYFDLNTLPTMIRKIKFEGDKLRLIAKNPTYGDIVINLNEVNNIATIVGVWRSHFGDQYDEIEALRVKKEQQIDNLIGEIRDAGKRTDVLMHQNLELMKKLLEK